MARSGSGLLACTLVVGVLSGSGHAATWYVGPQGKPDAAGTRDAPWDIESALAGGQKRVAPGDAIELLAGTYRRRPKELFDVKLAGTETAPVHVRPAPGERATIDGGLNVL